MKTINLEFVLDSNNPVLNRTTNLVKEPRDGEIWVAIQLGYKSNKAQVKWLASLLNAILTNKSPYFIISKSMLTTLLKDDANLALDRNSGISGSEYSTFIKRMVCSNTIEVIEAATEFDNLHNVPHKRGRRGSRCKILMPEVLNYLTEQGVDLEKEKEIFYKNNVQVKECDDQEYEDGE